MVQRQFLYIRIFITLLGGVLFLSQVRGQHDTVLLPPVVVNGLANPFPGGTWHEVFDSVSRQMMREGTLADLLAASHPLAMRYYGPGQLATASFRGSASSHTVVVWNGIRINNPMLMQTDFSSIPLAVIDGGGVLFGGATLREASGAFGGVVALRSIPDTLQQNGVELYMGGGSYNTHHYQARLRWSHRNTSSHTVYYTEQSENNFRYHDNFSMKETPQHRANASWFRQGVMHQTGISGKRGFSGQILVWGQQKFNYIPYPLHQPQGKYTQWQSDNSLRLLALGERAYGPVKLSVSTGVQHGLMQYSESRSGVAALHETRNLQHRTGIMREWIKTMGELSADYELQQALTTAYGAVKILHITALYGSVTHSPGKGFRMGLQARTEHISQYGADLMPAAYISVNKGQENRHLLKVMVMKNRQVPGLNDLFWIPGGNPDLEPEEGVSGELSLESRLLNTQSSTVKHRVVLYHQSVQRKIAWLPDSTTIWTARNVGHVTMSGVEAHIDISISGRGYTALWTLKAGYARAVRRPDDVGMQALQLIYVPQWTASSLLRVITPHATVALETAVNGKRFTNVANTTWMPPYSISGIRIMSREAVSVPFVVRAFVSVNNLFDEKYQMMAWYPMPGRTFRFGLSLRM
jgi:outer membrane cobalamin receptor